MKAQPLMPLSFRRYSQLSEADLVPITRQARTGDLSENELINLLVEMYRRSQTNSTVSLLGFLAELR